MFYSLIKKDKHLLVLVVSGNTFNSPTPRVQHRGALTIHTPAPSEDLALGEEQCTTSSCCISISAVVLDESYILILPLSLLINYKYLLLYYNSVSFYNYCFVP